MSGHTVYFHALAIHDLLLLIFADRVGDAPGLAGSMRKAPGGSPPPAPKMGVPAPLFFVLAHVCGGAPHRRGVLGLGSVQALAFEGWW